MQSLRSLRTNRANVRNAGYPNVSWTLRAGGVEEIRNIQYICKESKENAMELAKVTSKGQITIPLQIRRKLKLKEGDKVFWLFATLHG